MTELRHFHSARKGSGSLRPFPIYPLYTQTVILSLDKPIADCFLFRPRKRLEKRRKRSHTNAFQCIGHTDFNTSGTSGPRSLSHSKAGTHSAFGEKSHTAARTAKQGGHLCVVARSIWLPPHHSKNSRRKWMHANGVCPLPPASRPRRAAEPFL